MVRRKKFDESGFKTLKQAKSRLAEIEINIDKEEFGYFTKKNLVCDEYYEEYSLRTVKLMYSLRMLKEIMI
ncbi:hypothetical protein ACYSNW_14880 [Enterococcus sp. LJL99]